MHIKNSTILKIQSSGSDSFGKLLDVSEIPINAKVVLLSTMGHIGKKHKNRI